MKEQVLIVWLAKLRLAGLLCCCCSWDLALVSVCVCVGEKLRATTTTKKKWKDEEEEWITQAIHHEGKVETLRLLQRLLL